MDPLPIIRFETLPVTAQISGGLFIPKRLDGAQILSLMTTKLLRILPFPSTRILKPPSTPTLGRAGS